MRPGRVQTTSNVIIRNSVIDFPKPEQLIAKRWFCDACQSTDTPGKEKWENRYFFTIPQNNSMWFGIFLCTTGPVSRVPTTF